LAEITKLLQDNLGDSTQARQRENNNTSTLPSSPAVPADLESQNKIKLNNI